DSPPEFKRSCLVCSAPTTCTHLGMDICRACSSFFKRVKMTGKEYPCRQGDGKCPTTQAKRSICRRCRFDKCVTVGLKYGGPVIQRKLPAPSILERIEHEWKSMRDRRREKELQMVRTSHARTRVYHPTEEIYGVQMDCCHIVFNMLVAETFTLFKNIFPAFRDISFKEQELIFKDFMGKMAIAEGYYKTRQIWGGVSKFVMCSVVTCFDVEMKTEGVLRSRAASFLISYARAYADDQNEVFMPIFNRSKLVEREFYALIVLVMGELDTSCGVSEEALVLLDRYRQEALEGLQCYYQNELGLTDFSTRIGNLMSLNHAIQECKSLFKVFFRFFSTMFDVMIAGDRMKHFFL
ncbi:hypothetical protein PFISCL1PPCAC_13189, partial [Pristionchus fissidentatus]